MSKDVIVSNLANAIYDAEKWLFALLTSKMHNLWVRTVGGRLKTDYRYSATLCYNTFPFPKLTTVQKEELERLAQNILNIRDENFDMTLGEMYNPETMPEELREAHHQLDLAVERIYRPEPFASDEERLEHLFKLYAKMTKKMNSTKKIIDTASAAVCKFDTRNNRSYWEYCDCVRRSNCSSYNSIRCI